MRYRTFVGLVLAVACMERVDAQTMYKCAAEGGRIAYQETPCATASQQTEIQRVGPNLGRIVRNAGVLDAMRNRCTGELKNWIAYKDPDSVRIADGAVAVAFEVWMKSASYAGKALRASLSVNAKNSYGGYVGEKTVWCYTSLDGGKVLGISPDVLME